MRCLFAVVISVLATTSAAMPAATPQLMSIAVLRQAPAPLSWETLLTRPPEDLGLAGARLAIRDNQTTGRFLQQEFTLAEASVGAGEDPLPAFDKLVADGAGFVLLDLPTDRLLQIADAAKGRNLVLFNAGASDDRLRGRDCRADLLHIAPSRAMLTDALAQYLMTKKWRNWLLIVGRQPGDAAYAQAVRSSAKKFGARIVAEKPWTFSPDSRTSAQAEVPLLTQGISYDIAVIADETGEFGDLVMYRTWDPRLTAGTQGLVPTSFDPAHELWGASQLESRFMRQSARPMLALDYQMWQAVAALGEAATRTRSVDPSAIGQYLRSPDFQFAAFKGVPLTFRAWDGQLRQPILLAHGTAIVSVSPQSGYLHQRTPLDTLGADEPDSDCPLAKGGRR
jgi:ABC transporter substrate binding protein (PQQ-dependent alcohol dehydrogenase system)